MRVVGNLVAWVAVAGVWAEENVRCWEELKKCPFDEGYRCTSAAYDAHLAKVTCPERLREPMLRPDQHLLVYGPSYVGQIFKAIACLHHRSRLIAETHPSPRDRNDRFVRVRLVNNATITCMVNLGDFQTSSGIVKGLVAKAVDFGWTHAIFMEPHPECHYSHDCKALGDSVADKATYLKNYVIACITRATFATVFAGAGKAWVHMLPYAAMWDSNKIKPNTRLRSCEMSLLHTRDDATKPPILIDMHKRMDANRCPVKECDTHSYSGHQCMPGQFNVIAVEALHALLNES